MIYRAGIVGCGRIGSEFDDDPKRKWVATHAGAYSAISKTKLVAVADINKEKLEKCAKKWGVKSVYTDYKKMLKNEDLDFLSICTWSSTHLEIAKEALYTGVKAIWCEKPIANNLKSADEMIKICEENNIVLMIDHQRRYDTFHREVKKFIDDNRLGNIQQVTFYYTAGIANSGTHMFDLLRFFFGNVEWVHAFYANKNDVPEDPNIDGYIKFKNGISCSVQSCNVNNFYIFDASILGTKGRLDLTNAGFDSEFYEARGSATFSGYKSLFRSEPQVKNLPKDFMVNAVRDMIDCVENKKKPYCSGEDGRASLELICAFHESAQREGKRIYLPLKNSNIDIKSK